MLRANTCTPVLRQTLTCTARRRHYSLLNVFREPPKNQPDSHLPWEDRDNGPLLMRVTFATIGLAGLSIFGMYKLAGPDSDVAEHVGLIFNPYSWTQSMITATHDATPNTKLITLAIPRPYTPKITDKYRPIWHIYVKDDDIMVERPYTPLTGFDVGNQMQIWVKRYDQGEVGRWLHDKDRGNTVEVRGPVRTWSPPDEDLDEIVFISGGTGVTPFLQLFQLYVKNASLMPKTKFTLLHSAKTPADLLPGSYLSQLSDFANHNPERLNVKFFVGSDPRNMAKRDSDLQNRLTVGRIGRRDIQDVLPASIPWYRRLPYLQGEPEPEKRRMFLVCGPPSLIADMAGPYGRNFSQGVIGGHLKDLGFRTKDVYKL